MLHVALLSCWHVHTRMFVKAMLESGKADLSVVWDDDKERGKKFAEELKLPFEEDLDKVLARPDIDAVMCECATTLHKEVIIAAAKAKKHVFTDKAMAPTVADCEEIAQAVKDAGIVFTVSFESLSTPATNYAKKLIDSGKLGQVTEIHFRRAHNAAVLYHTPKQRLPEYWFDLSQTGGGAMFDLGCHGMYLLPLLAGKPIRLSAMMKEMYGTGAEESATVLMEFENGIIATAHTSFVAYQMDNLMEIVGTDGTLIVTGTDERNYKVLLTSKHLPGYEDILTPVDPSEMEGTPLPILQFIDACESRNVVSPAHMSVDDGTRLTVLMQAAYESQQAGKTVTIQGY